MSKEQFVKMMEERNKGNNHSPVLDAQEAVNILLRHFMGDDWYVNDPLPAKQCNFFIVEAILGAYPRRWYNFKQRLKEAIKIMKQR